MTGIAVAGDSGGSVFESRGSRSAIGKGVGEARSGAWMRMARWRGWLCGGPFSCLWLPGCARRGWVC